MSGGSRNFPLIQLDPISGGSSQDSKPINIVRHRSSLVVFFLSHFPNQYLSSSSSSLLFTHPIRSKWYRGSWVVWSIHGQCPRSIPRCATTAACSGCSGADQRVPASHSHEPPPRRREMPRQKRRRQRSGDDLLGGLCLGFKHKGMNSSDSVLPTRKRIVSSLKPSISNCTN